MRRRGRSWKKRKLRYRSNRMLETEVLTTLMRRTLTYPSIAESKLPEGNDTHYPTCALLARRFVIFRTPRSTGGFGQSQFLVGAAKSLSTGIIINVFFSIAHVFDASFLVIAFQSTTPALTHTKQPLKCTRCTPIPA